MHEFQWDDANIDHLALHHVEPFEVEEAIADPYRIARQAYNTPTERRRAIVGATEAGRLLTVIYTHRQKVIRVISAYDAGERDARRYDRARRP